MADEPAVLVLLATHNGAAWLSEQIDSILRQDRVLPTIVVSDDASTDGTQRLLKEWAGRAPVRLMPNQAARMGSAHRNFLRLICETSVSGFDYISLADQDDIWLPNKLARAVEQIRTRSLDAYSSDAVAFWPDGRERYLKKSSPQQERDYLLESAGPGCSYVWPHHRFIELQSWAQANRPGLENIRVHDWLIYAFARCRQWRWLIDSSAGLRYRQHASNEVGANVGLKAARHRVKRIRSGNFRRDVVAIADAVGDVSREAAAFRRFRLRDRAFLLTRVRALRRRSLDSLYLAALLLLMT